MCDANKIEEILSLVSSGEHAIALKALRKFSKCSSCVCYNENESDEGGCICTIKKKIELMNCIENFLNSKDSYK